MPSSDIAITGIGMVTPTGIGRTEFFDAVRRGSSGIKRLTELCPDEHPDAWVGPGQIGSEAIKRQPSLAIGAPITGFDAKRFVRPRKALKVMCREIQTSYAASQLAIADAGLGEVFPLDPPSEDSNDDWGLQAQRVGTVFGSEMLYGRPTELADAFTVCLDEHGGVAQSRFGGAAMHKITPLWLLKYLPNMPACHVGIAIGAHGPNNTLTVGDVSGPAAVMEACGYLSRGIADLMVCSASGSRLNVTRSVFSEDQPQACPVDPLHRSSRPHATDCDGIVRGEAAAGFILESEQSIRQRSRRPIVWIRGGASRFVPADSFLRRDRNASLAPDAGRASSRSMRLAIEAAMRQADVSADRIGLVVAHGMGDPVIDAAEREALLATVPDVPLCLPISTLGHTGAASGMVELATAVLSLVYGVVPPVPHAESCHGGLSVSEQARDLDRPFALVLTHTSAGAATALVLEQAAPPGE